MCSSKTFSPAVSVLDANITPLNISAADAKLCLPADLLFKSKACIEISRRSALNINSPAALAVGIFVGPLTVVKKYR